MTNRSSKFNLFQIIFFFFDILTILLVFSSMMILFTLLTLKIRRGDNNLQFLSNIWLFLVFWRSFFLNSMPVREVRNYSQSITKSTTIPQCLIKIHIPLYLTQKLPSIEKRLSCATRKETSLFNRLPKWETLWIVFLDSCFDCIIHLQALKYSKILLKLNNLSLSRKIRYNIIFFGQNSILFDRVLYPFKIVD